MIRAAGLLVFLPLAFLPLRAQPRAELSGVISDPSGGVVAGASISVTSEDTGFRRLTQSQAGGRYMVTSLEAGVYRITTRKEGFRTVVRLGVRLESAHPTRVDFALPIGSVFETITVTAEPDSVNDSFAPETIVTREEIERLPSSGRGLMPAIELAPGTVITPATRGEAGQFTVNGQRPNTHYFMLDGVSVNSGVSGGGAPSQATGGSLPAMTAFGSFHSLASLDALEEMRMRNSGEAPDAGRLPGIQIALTSRSGTNQFHGGFSGSLRHEKLDANDWFANRIGAPRAPLRLSGLTPTLSGPLIPNRLFFFASHERIRFRQPLIWRSAVPALESRERAPAWSQPLLRLFPAPAGADLGRGAAEWSERVVRPARFDGSSLRLDYLAASRASVFARYQHAPSYAEFGGWDVNQLSVRTQAGTLGVNLRLTPRWIVDLRANASAASASSFWRRADGSLLPNCYLAPVTKALTLSDACPPFFRFTISGVGTEVWGRESDTWQRQVNAIATVALHTSSHQLRVGADYRLLAPRRRTPADGVSVLSEGMAEFLEDRSLWMAISRAEETSGLLEEWSAFIQDTWRIHRRLTLTYGLRWEFNPASETDVPLFGLDNGGSPFSPAEIRPLWPARYDNLAPRFGMSYRLTPSGNTILRGGAGRYFDSSLSIATDLVNGGPFSVVQFLNPASHSHSLARLVMGYGFSRDLELPEIRQWNASIEHAFAGHAVSLGYAGSSGRRLLRREMGGPESTERVRVALATNHGSSDYHALLVQYQRRASRHLQTRVSYSWSHSIDNSSADGALHWVGGGLGAAADRGSSDFDARHALTAAFSLQPPRSNRRWIRSVEGWSLDGIVRARAGFPISVLQSEHSLGVSFANVFRPNLIAGRSPWGADPASPGGRRLNREAFAGAPPRTQGNLGRNVLGGFAMTQVDLALQREVLLGERVSALLRLEAFNALNQANLADPARFLTSPLFGESASMLSLMLGTGSPASGLAPVLQIGGPRSLQLSFRLRF